MPSHNHQQLGRQGGFPKLTAQRWLTGSFLPNQGPVSVSGVTASPRSTMALLQLQTRCETHGATRARIPRGPSPSAHMDASSPVAPAAGVGLSLAAFSSRNTASIAGQKQQLHRKAAQCSLRSTYGARGLWRAAREGHTGRKGCTQRKSPTHCSRKLLKKQPAKQNRSTKPCAGGCSRGVRCTVRDCLPSAEPGAACSRHHSAHKQSEASWWPQFAE